MGGGLPAGTVSMVFTDIEGSTMLLRRLGEQYLEALKGHRGILRGVWGEYGGIELGTEGDSFFVVFPSADSAVGAAVEGQRRLAGNRWPGGERLRVRMGIHTGTPGVYEDDYWGMDVHLAARIAGSAHGGQVVISAATGDVARLPQGASLRDLGMHHLKDIPEPEHLFQVTVAGLEQDFPPPRTVGTASSLPVPANPLLGREPDLARLTGLIRQPEIRLVTLTGPGGAGKTRLAMSVAAELTNQFPGGVYFVPLAAVTSEQVMWTSIAEVLDVPPRERSPARLTSYLANRALLLVLDNLEQVDGAATVVAQIIERAPQVEVVATSRRPLGLMAEHQHPVMPLDTVAEDSPAVQLFVQRAQAVQPRFTLSPANVADVVAICRHLDGLPLAIELCAPRVRVLSVSELLGRIDQRLDIASTSSVTPDRQRTLRDTIAWSYELLSPEHRRIFRRLAVFSGGADLAAITAVACDAEDPLDAVAELNDANLITISEGPEGRSRIGLLQTIRQYAGDELEATDEADAVRAAHASYYTGVAENLQALRESRHNTALELAESELDNFRAALTWSTSADIPTSRRLCAALGWAWLMAGYIAESRRWHEQVVAQSSHPSADLAACLRGLGNLLLLQGETDRAYEVALRSLEMSRALDDRPGIAYAMALLGTTQRQQGEVHAAERTLVEALDLHRHLDDKSRLARVLGHLGGIEEELDRLERAEALLRESLALYEALGDVYEAAVQGQNLAFLLVVSGRVVEAGELVRELAKTILAMGSPSLMLAFANTAMNILIREGDLVGAAHLFGAEEAMGERLEIANPYLEEELEEAVALINGVMSRAKWEDHRRTGRSMRVEELLARL
ncbi:ATP-binding protein [Kribbella sp. NBC_00889]|uniref:ATP-binding protein n=1 Tax=Kribbella sp. NBC_00889 TaxID=2975974 RepID=UPI00386E5724|nr:adenylate/guanylate cyclase domain-containing protein [Kribbella sp. NBC_00889]